MDESWLKDGWMDESEQMGWWVHGWMDGWKNGWENGLMVKELWLMDRWVRTDGWMNEWSC